ncbi:uncharacterized protein [Anabrus simplex]|uniref:uncharacterized protein n=1 Tax=Anabrus simplex TaxID=316456 RepID=UPI0035A2D6D1
MYCQLGQDILQLRQQNRDLLRELESNSVLLENRIMKLRDTVRTPRHSDKSWKELPPSPLKRKYESWKARNSSSHISAARTESTDPEQENVKPSSNSTAKRSKRNITIVSGVKKKHRHSQCHEQPKTSKPTSEKSTKKQKIIQKEKKPCAQCYCPDIYIETENKTDGSTVTGNVYIDTKGCEIRTCSGCCGDHSEIEGLPSQGSLGDGEGLSRKTLDSQSASNICPVAESVHFTTPCSSPHLVKSLEDVYSVLNYSPESVFLRRFKKRAELLQRKFQADPVEDKKSKTARENKAQHDSDSDPGHVVKKLHGRTRTRQVPTRVVCSNRSKRCASKIKSAQEKHPSSRITRVPVHQLCSCRCRGDRTDTRSPREKKSPQKAEAEHIPILPLHSSRDGSVDTGGIPARDQSRFALRDLEHKSCAEREDISRCRCCQILASQRCPCKACRCRTIHKYLNDQDTASELGMSGGDCCCPKAPDNKAWFEELKRFRYKNWCECHAHDHDHLPEKGIDLDLGTDLFQLDPPQPEERCLERFVIGGVEYFIPGYAVPSKKTTCTWAKASTAQCEESPLSNNLLKEVKRNKITLPSKRKPKETSPRSPWKETVRKSSKIVSKGTPGLKRQPSYLISRTSSVTKYKAPVPTNTFALRYQRGVM